MKLIPTEDRVLIKRLEEQEVTKGGIIIPDTAKEKPARGRIIAVGPGKADKNGQKIPMTVKPGQVVLFGKYSGNDIKVDDEDHLVVREDDIMGILEE